MKGLYLNMPIQDDSRETIQIDLFGLERPPNSNRSGIDAILVLENGEEIPFELKTTTTGSVTTVRDFGPEHIIKWKNKHWLISRFSHDGEELLYTLYGNPGMMSKWITEKENYIKLDFELAKLIPRLITINDAIKLVGDKPKYSLADAKNIQKRQYSIERYHDLMDFPDGYSPQRLLKIIKDRCRYVIERGSTLNNPHIPESYFDGWDKITDNHENQLLEMVNNYFNEL